MDYKGALHCFPSGETVIRLLLLLWTGHHPAQCEICKSKGAGGTKECRMYFQVCFCFQVTFSYPFSRLKKMIIAPRINRYTSTKQTFCSCQ